MICIVIGYSVFCLIILFREVLKLTSTYAAIYCVWVVGCEESVRATTSVGGWDLCNVLSLLHNTQENWPLPYAIKWFTILKTWNTTCKVCSGGGNRFLNRYWGTRIIKYLPTFPYSRILRCLSIKSISWFLWLQLASCKAVTCTHSFPAEVGTWKLELRGIMDESWIMMDV